MTGLLGGSAPSRVGLTTNVPWQHAEVRRSTLPRVRRVPTLGQVVQVGNAKVFSPFLAARVPGRHVVAPRFGGLARSTGKGGDVLALRPRQRPVALRRCRLTRSSMA